MGMILTPEPVCLFVEHTIPRERFLSLAIFPFDRGDHAVDARLDLGYRVARDVEARRHLAGRLPLARTSQYLRLKQRRHVERKVGYF